jgi:hypothetical protein
MLVMVFGLMRAMNAFDTWRIGRSIRRGGSRPYLDPESRFVVRLSDTDVVCARPDGTRERVTWDELQRVEIVNTSDGPMRPDTFWLLVGDEGGCAIPWGATGEPELIERLQQLPGFSNEAVIGAATDTGDARRTCWVRSAGTG